MAPEGPQPDLVLRNKLKAKYFKIQRRYFRALDVCIHALYLASASLLADLAHVLPAQIRRDLEIEAQEKDDKLCRLQDEIEYVALTRSGRHAA